MKKLRTLEDEQIVAFFASIDRMEAQIDNFVKSYRPTLYGERYLTDKELSKKLHISPRTLHLYRTQRKIPYFHLGGKVLYRESDVDRWIEENYREGDR